MKLLASIVLASIFMGAFVGLKTQLDRASKYTEFKKSGQELATVIESVGSQSPGGGTPHEINIPENCAVKFEGENVIVIAKGSKQTHPTGVKINGKTLNSGHYNLSLTRTENGVEISE